MNLDNLILPKTKEIICCKLKCKCGFEQYPIELGILPKKICPECGNNLITIKLKEID